MLATGLALVLYLFYAFSGLRAAKMATAGADWLINPTTQITWGLGYIKGRYGTPCSAWAMWQSRSPHWY